MLELLSSSLKATESNQNEKMGQLPLQNFRANSFKQGLYIKLERFKGEIRWYCEKSKVLILIYV